MISKILEKDFFVSCDEMTAASLLINDLWEKKNGLVFQKNRNSFDIEVDGRNHPLWKVKITPKNNKFNELDWKLKQDINKLKNLGKPKDKRIFLNDKNEKTIKTLTKMLITNRKLSAIYSDVDGFILFWEDINKIRIFKVIASGYITKKGSEWYMDKKKLEGI